MFASFALQRISRAEVLEQTRQMPDGFELTKYIHNGAFHYSNGQTLPLQLHIYSDEVARNLQESPLATDQKLDGKR